MEQNVSAFDRLFFAFILAIAVFVLLIFGISFSFPDMKGNASKSIEVTLVQHQSAEADEDADFLADANQQGSGSADEAQELSTTEESEFEDSRIHKVDRFKPVVSIQFQPKEDEEVLDSMLDNEFKVNNVQADSSSKQGSQEAVTEIQISEITDIATLKAMLDNRRQEYAKRPRVRTLTALSTKRAVDASYVYQWLKKVERIGNNNYPQLAKDRKIFGDVRVVVSITADGKVKKSEIVSSSGYKILDDAAKQIIALSSPFDPFPSELRKDTDVVEIIRTWRFEPGDKLTSSN